MRARTIGYGLLIGTLALGGCGSDSDDSSNGGSGGGGGSGGSGGGSSGSSGNGGSSGASQVPFDDLLGKIIELQCNAVNSCAGDLFSLVLAGSDCETFIGRGIEDQDWPNIETAVEDGRVIYHGDKAQACLDAWAALECDLFTMRAPDICEEALEGTVDEGGDCTLSIECAGPLFCKIEGACPGSCSPRLTEGSACRNDDECNSGMVCDDTLDECVVPGEVGDSCKGGEPDCVFGLFCANAEAATPGTCKSVSEVLSGNDGEPCDFTGEWCKLGSSCVLEDWTASGPVASCKPQVASGAACGIGIPNQCPAGEYCNADPASGSFEGLCVDLPGDGDACVGIEGLPQCAPYHVCDANEVCREIQRLDGNCGGDAECYSANCDTGKCSPTDPCASD